MSCTVRGMPAFTSFRDMSQDIPVWVRMPWGVGTKGVRDVVC
jgi:hypothetical protein